MMKAAYLCGFTSFHEFVCYDHPKESYAYHKAKNWVKFRLPAGSAVAPANCSALIEMAKTNKIKQPKRIQVIMGGRYPSIEDMSF